jgi:hypothetical protein
MWYENSYGSSFVDECRSMGHVHANISWVSSGMSPKLRRILSFHLTQFSFRRVQVRIFFFKNL